MESILLQDIHLGDENFWGEFQYYWKNSNYRKALEVLTDNQQLVTKYVSADWLNSLTALVYQLEILPDNLNKKQIKTSFYPPANLEVGDIWFQLELGDVLIDVNTYVLSSTSSFVVGSYNGTLINSVAYSNEEVVIINQEIDEINHTVTFSAELEHDAILCIIYSTDNTHVVASTTSISIGTTSFQMSYSGNLLSAMFLDNNNNIQLVNLSVGASSVNYNLLEPTSVVASGRIVYIPTQYLSDILNFSTKTFSNTSTTLLTNGYMVNCFLTDSSNNVVIGDVSFDFIEANINVPQNSSSLKCDLYYT